MWSHICMKNVKNWTIVERDIYPKKRRIPWFTVITTLHVAILKATGKGI